MTPQQAAALLQSGAITYAQYQQAVGIDQGTGAPAQAPPPVPAGAPVYSPAASPNMSSAVNGAPVAGPAAPELSMGANADPATAGMTPDQIAAIDRGQAPAPEAPAAQGGPKRLVVAGQGGAESKGATESQGPAQDPLAAILRPQGAGGAHRVGYSPADKDYIGALGSQAQAEQANAAEMAGHIGRIADSFAQQNDALAAESKQGVLDYQEQLRQNAARRAQIDADAKTAQDKINAKIADLEATGVDPNHYFQSQSTGQRILGALAIGLGGFASHGLGPNGHESTNTALEIMNNAISRDIDAQKTNLQKSLSVLGQRMNLNAQGFDQQKALLEAERESIQSAYAVAANETAKRAAQFRDNAEVQTNAAKIINGLQGTAVDKVGQLNQQLYGIEKNAERVVGGSGSGDLQKYVRERTPKLIDEAAANGKTLTAADAHRMAVQEYAGVDVNPGAATPDITRPQKGNKGPTGKAAEQADALSTAINKVDQLIEMRQKAGLFRGGEQGATADAISLGVRTLVDKGLGGRMSPELLHQFSTLVPEHPLERNAVGLVGSDPTMAKLKATKAFLEEHRQQILSHPDAGGESTPSPADLGLTEEEAAP